MEELKKSAKMTCKDFFNRVEEIYNHKNYRMNRRESCLLDYSDIKEIKVHHLEGKYETCENGKIIEKETSKEAFDEIQFIMSNGNIIHICPEDAINDEYLDVWATGTKEDFKDYKDEEEFRDFLHTKVGKK